jgi:uncharacterized membrane protein YjjP (DUF1212 family)
MADSSDPTGSSLRTGRGIWRRLGRQTNEALVRAGEAAARRIAAAHAPAVRQEEVLPAQPPEAVLEVLRDLGAAMCRAGDAVDRIGLILDDVAIAFGAEGVRYFVLPTGLFVRIEAGGLSRVDFALAGGAPLRLDQVDDLYRLVHEIRLGRVDAEQARTRLDDLMRKVPRFNALTTIVGTGILTVGLGLVLNPSTKALAAYLGLGLLVGILRWYADRNTVVSLILTVVTSFVVTWLTFQWVAEWADAKPLDIVIPALVTLLPGAMLTMATVELSTGSMLSGSSRLIFGLERLLLLAFGIAMGAEAVGQTPHIPDPAPSLGIWASWLGVLVFGVGQYIASSAPRRTLLWLLLVLYVAYATQAGAGLVVGSLGASFVAGAVVLPVAYAVQYRRSGPPVPVTFLPAFWLLVPGALGLEGVAEIVGANDVAGLGDFLNALLTIVAIAVGVLVGAGVAERIGRVTSTWQGL